jgi:hypothetical protein
MFSRFNPSTFQRCNFLAAFALLVASCAGHRHFRVIREGATISSSRYLELRSEASVATLHFPAGLYSLYALDDAGLYYRASRKIVQHTTSGPLWRDGGIFVSKRNPRKLRGYVFFAGALTHVGDLSRTQNVFRD